MKQSCAHNLRRIPGRTILNVSRNVSITKIQGSTDRRNEVECGLVPAMVLGNSRTRHCRQTNEEEKNPS